MDHKTIIRTLGGPRRLAEDMGLKVRRVRGWSERNSIPAEYWPSIVRVADETGADVSLETLVNALHTAA